MFGKSGRLQYVTATPSASARHPTRRETGGVLLVMACVLASAITACAVELAFRLV